MAYLINLGQLRNLGSMQDSQRQANHLQILAAGRGGDVPGLGAYIIDDRLLQPRNEEMGSLIHDRLLDSTQTIEDDSTSATFDIIDGSLDEGEPDGGGDGEFVKRR